MNKASQALRRNLGVLIFLSIWVAVFVAAKAYEHRNDPASPDDAGMTRQAEAACIDAVSQRLRSPGSAHFLNVSTVG